MMSLDFNARSDWRSVRLLVGNGVEQGISISSNTSTSKVGRTRSMLMNFFSIVGVWLSKDEAFVDDQELHWVDFLCCCTCRD